MKPLPYSLQFRGVARPGAPGILLTQGTAPSAMLLTVLDDDGVHGQFESMPGDEAVLEQHTELIGDVEFVSRGSITFGYRHSLRFVTVGRGQIGSTPDRHLRHGAAIALIDGGTGQFEGATGRIASNFFLSDTGELTDHHLGLVFVERRTRETPEAIGPGGDRRSPWQPPTAREARGRSPSAPGRTGIGGAGTGRLDSPASR